MEIETTGIVISSGAVGALAGVASTWIKSKVAQRHARPLDTADTFVTHGECQSHRCAIEKRIDELGPALNRIFTKLADNDKRSEERTNQMHRRLDPVLEKVAATAAEVQMLKGKSK